MPRLLGLQRDDGFTLVELIIGMAIVGILVGAMGSALIVGLRTTTDTGQRLSESHDAQISSAYLANDVQSAQTITVAAGGASCASTTQLVSFTYKDSKVARYACGPAAGETQVTRTFDGTTVVIAHFAGIATPNVTCTGCGSPPARVQIAFTEASGFNYTLVGSQRATSPGSGGGGTGGTTDVTLFVIGAVGGGGTPLWVSGSCPPGQIDNPGNPNNTCTADSESGSGQPTNPKLTVLGNLYVNAGVAGAVRLSGRKSDVRLSVQGGDFKILSPGTCTGCTPQTVVCSACTTTPPPGSYTPALLDPLRFMTAPSETGLPVYSDGNNHGPGIYTTTLTIGSSTTFAPGIYILNNGISITGSSTVTGNGVMLYNKGGSINFAGSSTFNVRPASSGQYKGIVIFQSRTNTNSLSLAGNSGNNPIGIVYAPSGSSVTLGTGSAILSVTAVVAQNIKVSGNAQVTIG